MAYSTISKPSDYFNTKLYTGNSTDNHAITGVNFQPDLVWIKRRNQAANHNLFDAVRGATKTIKSNLTNAEATVADTLKSFDSDGFTLGDDATVGEVNPNTYTMASWNWLGANGTASNTDGSITSTVSANTTSGFSIVSYTGTGANATVGHGLGSVPKVVMVKTRSGTGNWINYHSSVGNTKYLSLNQTNSAGTTNQAWNDTSPTNQVFSLGNSSEVNGNGTTMIAYCFADVQGYSKFGSYVGNASTNGTFVYTGFAPSFLMIKRTSDTQNWYMWDNKRLGYNPDNNHLQANGTDAEGTADAIDILSNGFKIRESGAGTNSGTYIYMSFAAEPLVANVSSSIPATAR